MKWLSFIFLTLIVGCAGPGPTVLKMDYVDFDKSYADVNNQQMLLNLARLANDDPVNFLQLGSFSAQYQFMAGMGFSPSFVDNHPGFYTSTFPTPSGSGNIVTRSVGTFLKMP